MPFFHVMGPSLHVNSKGVLLTVRDRELLGEILFLREGRYR